MLDKKRGYAYNRPFWNVDSNVNIQAGMVAFLTTSGGTVVATTAASGTVPIGTFWKDRANGFIRSVVESKTFNASNILTASKGNFLSTATVKVYSGATVYTQGVDFTLNTNNGVVTRIAGGAITASATVSLAYRYTVSSTGVYWDNVSTKWSTGWNYDRQPDDTLGSSKITIATGDAIIFTDQYDVTQTYTLNQQLYSDASSLWTNQAGTTSACGRVVQVPTASDPWLGVQQITVVA
jgi:hypothetical protein